MSLCHVFVSRKLTDGNVGTTLGDHTRGSGASDIVEALADTGEISGLAVGLAGDSVVKARNSALGDVAEGLSRDGGGEGSNSERVLHLEGCSWLSFKLINLLICEKTQRV